MIRLIANIRGKFTGGPVRRYYVLRAAYSITAELILAIDIEDCLKILVNRIASYMNVEIVSVMFVDNDKRRLIVKISRGLDEETVRDSSVRIGEGIAGWVGKTGEPLLIKDITKDTRFMARVGNRYYNNSLLSVPLKIRDNVIGVINVNNKVSKDIFRESDLELLKTISDMAVVALEDIRLEDEVGNSRKNNIDLISNISHDLKTPIATIKATLAIMLEGISGAISEDQKKYLELSMQNADRLSRMVDDLLQSARAQRAALTLNRNLFNVTQTAKDILDSLGVLAKEKGIELAGAIPDKKIEIWGDPDKLNQVITNLIDNAIKYNRPEGKIEVSLKEDEGAVTIAVSDTGMGIPKDDLARVFDRFYRLGRDADSSIPGTGLGLSIVKDIVRMHKGDIRVESQADKGTRFVITLPKDLRR